MNGETTDVGFINYSLRPWMSERSVILPIEVLVSEHALRHRLGIIHRGTYQVSFWADGSYPRAGPKSQFGTREIAVAKGSRRSLWKLKRCPCWGWYGPSTR